MKTENMAEIQLSANATQLSSIDWGIDLFKGLKKIVYICNLVDSPTRRVGGSFFSYEYHRKFEAKIRTARSC